jgi:hypothetical protein
VLEVARQPSVCSTLAGSAPPARVICAQIAAGTAEDLFSVDPANGRPDRPARLARSALG